MCKKPFVKGISPFPCGQCLPCRLNRRRLWTHRLLLEQHSHEFSSFATLTYSDDALPAGNTLVPKHTQDWLKRLRALLGPARPLRYYLVGEYGDESQRPHYHAALFGLSHLEGELLRTSWGHGHIQLGTLTKESAQYIAGYVTKKMTAPDDPRLQGRHPEFARMSLRPGIGAFPFPSLLKPSMTNMVPGSSLPLATFLSPSRMDALRFPLVDISGSSYARKWVSKLLEVKQNLRKNVMKKCLLCSRLRALARAISRKNRSSNIRKSVR